MEQPLSSDPSPAAEPSRLPMSLGARLLNIVATPGEVYEQVRDHPPAHANWWLPLVLLCVAGILSTWVVLSQPQILQNIREAKEKAMEKQLAKMPAAQRQQVMALADKFSSPIVLKALGTLSAMAGSCVRLFGVALLIWAFGVIFYKADFSYLKAMEASGLAAMIPLLGVILSMLLIVITGNVGARLSPAAFLSQFDPANPAHLLLASLNVITLWYIGLIALAVAKLSRRSALVPALCFYGAWALFQMATITFSLMAQRLQA